jgi:peptidoglycan hydrolase CwlO-like protein
MSLHEKSSQTISNEIENFKAKIQINRSRIDVLTAMLNDMEMEIDDSFKEIRERQNQLNLRAKQRI